MIPELVATRLSGCRRILLAGCGGGYDVFGALPLMHALQARGIEVHLANLSFSDLAGLTEPVPGFANLYPVHGEVASESVYCPEAWLARWLAHETGYEHPVWGFSKTGVKPLAAAYRHLCDTLGLDGVMLIDGGIDAILAGDESSIGTPTEDLVSLGAVRELDLPMRLIACVGFGAELRDGICHEQVLARIADLQRREGFLGTASLLATTEAGRFYRRGLEYVFAHQRLQKRSHIHEVIVKAMDGEFGRQDRFVWISPLLNMYWHFELEAVAAAHRFLPELAGTETVFQASLLVEGLRDALPIQPRTGIPI